MAEQLRLDPRRAQQVAHTAFWATRPYEFLTQCCFTRDEVDKDRVKLIPPKPHIRQLVYEWEHYRLLAIPKSRRMIVTWTLIALDLWLAMFRRFSRINIISSDQTKSDSLVGRVKFIYERLPDTCLRPAMKVHLGKLGEPTRLDFIESESIIQGLSREPDKIRQEGATLLHIEEMAFWLQAESAYKAMLPAIQGSGRMVIASSAQAGSIFGQIVQDDLGESVVGDPTPPTQVMPLGQA